MSNYEKWKMIVWLCVLLLIFSVVFNTGRFSCLNDFGKHSGAFVGVREFTNYRALSKVNRSPDEIIAEMRADGWLKNGFRQWFVAPNGKSDEPGTIDAPLDLATALDGGRSGARIKPGDLVWLRGGRYAGLFTAKVAGENDRPIHFRQYPGERAVIDKNESSREKAALTVRSPNVWFWDFEVANSNGDRKPLDGEKKLDPRRGSGINVFAPDTKYIDLVVHDNGHGFGLWNEAGGTEIYGCLIFSNGDNKKEHGVYAHNRAGTQTIADNFIFNNAGYGLHIYADSAKSSITGFNVVGNTIFNNGALTGLEQVADQILVGGVAGAAADRIAITENFVFCPPDAPTAKNRGVRLGYEDKNNGAVNLSDNLIACKVPLKVLWWRTAQISRNTITAGESPIVIETPSGSLVPDAYVWEANRYLPVGGRAVGFELNDRRMDFGEWRALYKFDGAGEVLKPAGLGRPLIGFRQNRYDSTRANLTIFNIAATGSVEFTPQNFLRRGDLFEIYDAQNFFAPPILSGTYQGGALKLPLAQSGLTPTAGETERPPVHTKADFAAFVLLRRAVQIPGAEVD